MIKKIDESGIEIGGSLFLTKFSVTKFSESKLLFFSSNQPSYVLPPFQIIDRLTFLIPSLIIRLI